MKRKHQCAKNDIKWDENPSVFENNLIRWYGRCSLCKKSVYELYEQQPEVYDAETDKEPV